MIIKGLQKLTLVDYPGKVACTIFVFGCNFRCPFCQNPSLVIDDGSPAIEEKEILNFLSERKGFLDGVCITGGEPTLQDDLPEFIRKIKSLGFLVKLDTNGTNPDMLKELIDEKLIDYVAMDIKTRLDFERYRSVVRALDQKEFEKVKKSIEVIRSSGVDYEFRTTVVPTLLSQEDVVEIAKYISGAKLFSIQQFRPDVTLDKTFKSIKPYRKEELLRMKEECSKYVKCRLLGV